MSGQMPAGEVGEAKGVEEVEVGAILENVLKDSSFGNALSHGSWIREMVEAPNAVFDHLYAPQL